MLRDKFHKKDDDKNKAEILHSHAKKVREWASILGLLPNSIKEKKDLAYLTKIKESITKNIDSVASDAASEDQKVLYLGTGGGV